MFCKAWSNVFSSRGYQQIWGVCTQWRQRQVKFPHNLSGCKVSLYFTKSRRVPACPGEAAKLPARSLGHPAHQVQDSSGWAGDGHASTGTAVPVLLFTCGSLKGATTIYHTAWMAASYGMDYAFGIALVSVFAALRWPCAAGGLNSTFFRERDLK